MNADLIDKYLISKKNKIYAYSLMLSNIITIPKNTLWLNQKKFNVLIRPIIDYYVTNYYLSDEKINCSLNFTKDIDDVINRYKLVFPNSNINNILSFAYICFEKNNSIDIITTHNDEIILLGFILAISIDFDINNNPLTDKNINRDILENIFKLLKNLNSLKIDNKSKKITDFNRLLKKNYRNEKEFFKIFDNRKYYNEFGRIKDNIYVISFVNNINIPEIADKEYQEIMKVNNFAAREYFVSCNLLLMTMIKQKIINNRIDDFIIPYKSIVYEKENNYMKIFKMFKSIGIKEHISVLTNYDSQNIDIIKNNGFNIINNVNIIDKCLENSIINKESKRVEM